MELDPLLLSRLQFVWVIGWHILLPAFTVGLASYIALLEGMHFFTGQEIYFRISGFWIKIFSVAFGIGVVSGIVMPFQFGTNWSRYSDATANVLSPLFAYEGLTAFFLEAAFLGVLLFGRNLVPRWAHFVAALMVAFGTLLSSFWILSANSWMQTPVGYELVDGRFYPKDWFAIVFNPSFPYRFGHTVVGFYVTTAFVVVGVAAWLVRRGRSVPEGSRMLSMTLWLLTVLVPLQILLGDEHGLSTLEHQPTKLAAIEAHWETGRRVPLVLFALPDERNEANRYTVEVPLLGSLVLIHDLNGEIRGLKEWPRDQRPPVAIPFFAFRIMVGIGLLMLAMVAASWWLRWKGRLFDTSWYLQACQWVAPLGFVAAVYGRLSVSKGFFQLPSARRLRLASRKARHRLHCRSAVNVREMRKFPSLRAPRRHAVCANKIKRRVSSIEEEKVANTKSSAGNSERDMELPRYPCGNALSTAMQNPKFIQPVTVRAPAPKTPRRSSPTSMNARHFCFGSGGASVGRHIAPRSRPATMPARTKSPYRAFGGRSLWRRARLVFWSGSKRKTTVFVRSLADRPKDVLMSNPSRAFYTSSSGDRWLVGVGERDEIFVRHEPNRASGGQPSEVDIETFMARGPGSPEAKP